MHDQFSSAFHASQLMKCVSFLIPRNPMLHVASLAFNLTHALSIFSGVWECCSAYKGIVEVINDAFLELKPG